MSFDSYLCTFQYETPCIVLLFLYLTRWDCLLCIHSSYTVSLPILNHLLCFYLAIFIFWNKWGFLFSLLLQIPTILQAPKFRKHFYITPSGYIWFYSVFFVTKQTAVRTLNKKSNVFSHLNSYISQTVHLEKVQNTVIDVLKLQGRHLVLALKQVNVQISDYLVSFGHRIWLFWKFRKLNYICKFLISFPIELLKYFLDKTNFNRYSRKRNIFLLVLE